MSSGSFAHAFILVGIGPCDQTHHVLVTGRHRHVRIVLWDVDGVVRQQRHTPRQTLLVPDLDPAGPVNNRLLPSSRKGFPRLSAGLTRRWRRSRSAPADWALTPAPNTPS